MRGSVVANDQLLGGNENYYPVSLVRIDLTHGLNGTHRNIFVEMCLFQSRWKMYVFQALLVREVLIVTRCVDGIVGIMLANEP